MNPEILFGQVWHALDGTRYLVVSSDAYNTAFGDRRVLAVEVDPRGGGAGTYREPVGAAGTAHLDRLGWVVRRRLATQVAELPVGRHGHVAGVIRELIGN